MLTRDLLRVRRDGSQVKPQLLKGTPAVAATAEAILGHWQRGIGRMVGELEDDSGEILHGSRSLVVAKGLQKLVMDACGFREAPSAVELRAKAFAGSAARLAKPLADGLAHAQAVAGDLGMTRDALAEALYGDLPDRAVLIAAPSWSVAELLARYNLALCQGLLLSAKSLTATVRDADTGRRRRLLKALRWHRLLAEVEADADGALTLTIGGPDAVLDQASRYGLNLALFLRDLAACEDWRATAQVRVGQERSWKTLELDHELGLAGDSRWLGFVPDEVKSLHDQLATESAVTLQESPLLPLPSGELVVPDLTLTIDGRTVHLELFHRWHHAALKRRLGQLAGLPELLIGVDRAISKRPEFAGLADDARFAKRGFLFSDLPTARIVMRAIGR